MCTDTLNVTNLTDEIDVKYLEFFFFIVALNMRCFVENVFVVYIVDPLL